MLPMKIERNAVCIVIVFSFLSPFYRMRERGLWICGVGVWSLLLSLCLASFTHAHRSHTGNLIPLYVYCLSFLYIHVFLLAGENLSIKKDTQYWRFLAYFCKNPLWFIFFLCCKVGMKRLIHMSESPRHIRSTIKY